MTPEPLNGSQPAPRQQQIGPKPSPQAYRIQTVSKGGKQLVAIEMLGDCGQWVIFLDGDGALEFANQIRAAGREAKSGIVVARDGGLHL